MVISPHSAPVIPKTMPLSIWALTISGFTTVPQSTAHTTRPSVRVEALRRSDDSAQAQCPDHAQVLREELARHPRDDGRPGDPMGPGDRLALCIQAGSDPIVVARPVHVVLDVLLATPDHLYRAGDLLRNLHGPDDEVDLESPAEAAAQEMVVHLDLGLRQPGHLCRGGLGECRDLCSHPDVAPVGPHVDGAVHRLHCSVREERLLVDRLDLLRGTRHRCGYVAVLARDHA